MKSQGKGIPGREDGMCTGLLWSLRAPGIFKELIELWRTWGRERKQVNCDDFIWEALLAFEFRGRLALRSLLSSSKSGVSWSSAAWQRGPRRTEDPLRGQWWWWRRKTVSPRGIGSWSFGNSAKNQKQWLCTRGESFQPQVWSLICLMFGES